MFNFQKGKTIKIHEADKGGNIVIINKTAYNYIFTQLNNTECYKSLDNNLK